VSLEDLERDALTYSTNDVHALLQELEKLNLSTTWGDFVVKVKTLVADHGPEIAMAAIRLALRAAGVVL
jgi:hypothetical protein